MPKWHTLRSKRRAREGNPAFSAYYPHENRLKPGFDSLLEGSAANAGTHTPTKAYAPRSVKPGVL